MDMNMPQDSKPQEEPKDDSIMVNMSSLGDAGKMLKVGDEVNMLVSSIEGDMLQLVPDMEDNTEESDNTDPKTMPLDKLEASLPKAPERE